MVRINAIGFINAGEIGVNVFRETGWLRKNRDYLFTR